MDPIPLGSNLRTGERLGTLLPLRSGKGARMKQNGRNEEGQGLTEYLVLILLISVVSIAAAKALGNTVKRKLQEAEHHINQDVTLSGGE
jgi:Flp pilus assembly pilin Flp